MAKLNSEYIIFLDIDGVMNNSEREADDFLPEAVAVLNMLYNKYNAKVVLSSSWREFFTFDDLKELFEKNGLLIKIIDKTPVYVGSYNKRKVDKEGLTLEQICNLEIPEDAGRNLEIMNYIKIHDVCNYVILDDYDFTNEELKKHLIQTEYWGSENSGLNWSHLERIEEILQMNKNSI